MGRTVVPEFTEVFTKAGQPTGEFKPKEQVFTDGDWRLVTHVWIVNPATQELLVQQRAHRGTDTKKGIFDDLWDVSVGGGIMAVDKNGRVQSELSQVAAQRETFEELGVEFDLADFRLIGRYCVPKYIPERGQQMNEYSDTYLVLKEIPLTTLRLNHAEVATVKYMPIPEVLAATSDTEKSKLWVPHSAEYYTTVAAEIMKLL